MIQETVAWDFIPTGQPGVAKRSVVSLLGDTVNMYLSVLDRRDRQHQYTGILFNYDYYYVNSINLPCEYVLNNRFQESATLLKK